MTYFITNTPEQIDEAVKQAQKHARISEALAASDRRALLRREALEDKRWDELLDALTSARLTNVLLATVGVLVAACVVVQTVMVLR